MKKVSKCKTGICNPGELFENLTLNNNDFSKEKIPLYLGIAASDDNFSYYRPVWHNF